MASSHPTTDFVNQVEEYLRFSHVLIQECQKLDTITGMKKLEKKCLSEVRFFNALKQKSLNVQDCQQLKSSNLSHFAGIFHAVQSLPGVCKILQPFSDLNRPESLVVDIVANQGHAWVKVIARKGQALHLIWAGSGTNNQNEAVIKKVNLDITTLITLVSSVTHGGCNFVFQEPLLTEQAAEERKNPVLKDLKKFLEDKELYACRTAVDDFLTILETLGGANEKQRADELLKRVNIIPDQPSERTKTLPQTSKIKKRTKIIFGTGDQIEAVTVSANSGFVRAAEHQGVSYAVYLHPSRALTEEKEKSAVLLTDEHLSDNEQS